MSQDDIDHIPAIVPSREEGLQRGARSVPNERRRSSPSRPGTDSTGSSSGTLSRLLAGIALIAGGLAFAWAWQLQNQLDEAQGQLQAYATRIGDLEARLSDTDEGMNQNAAVQAVKIAELDNVVRKLWDNVWKQTKERLSKLESGSVDQNNSLRDVKGLLASAQDELNETQVELSKLRSVGGDLARLMTTAKTSQAEVERVADVLNRIELSLARLDKRVADNEEWVASINAFRRQVNASLSELQSTVRSLQDTPRSGP